MFNIPSFYGFRSNSGGVPFEFTVKTDNAGVSTSTQFQLPLVSSLPLNAFVYWGDGSFDRITAFNQAERLHTYPSAGTYTIKITGDLSGWQFANGGDKLKMLNVASWGALKISVRSGFEGCTNLTATATDAPLITSTSLANYFSGCSNFNGNIGNWNVANVTIMQTMFRSASAFNQDIGSWNVSNVRDMLQMFRDASAFNKDIGSWNVSNAISLNSMFRNAVSFNNNGNSNINNWNTSNVIDMNAMFRNAISFNQNIGNWDTSSVTTIEFMFENATAFNQDIGSWNVSNVTNFTNFMANKTAANFSAANLDSIYNGWSSRPVKPNINISFGSIKYTAAGQAGKDVLTNAPNLWTILDGGI